ncbi:MAG: 3-oxoacyl-ACP reductase [Bacteroidia bacterium]
MADFILEYGHKPGWKSIFSILGITVPPRLKRLKGSWKKQILAGKKVVTATGGINASVISNIYDELGGHALINSLPAEDRADVLLFDATGIETIAQLKSLYDFFHSNAGKLANSSRVVIIGLNPSGSAENVSAQQALEGFSRSVAKEVGRKGATVNLIRLENKSVTEKQLLPVLHFLFSEASAFVTAQVFRISSGGSIPQIVPLENSLTGKIALVTGAARGIGEATARKLAAEGATVIVLDRPEDSEEGKKVADSINGKFLAADMSKEDSATIINDYLKKEYNGVDIVIHNAGITRDKTIAKMDEKYWDMVLNVNLEALIRTNNLLLKSGTIRNNGRIVCLSSISGFSGNFGQTNYAATKAGIIGYVKALAEELAANNITANAVAPGFIETKMTAKMPLFTKMGGRRLSNLNQGGLAEDVADMITFLSSPGAAVINGQTQRVCGGSYIGA